MAVRHLAIICGDQLNFDSAIFDDFDKAKDCVWMAEVNAEATQVWNHKVRIALFLSAMRHFRDELLRRGFRVEYTELEDPANTGSLEKELARALNRLVPRGFVKAVEPGECRVREALRAACPLLQYLPDRHFLATPEDFASHAEGRKQFRMEFFYREMRRRYNILMDADQPEGGQWNYDAENRGSFGKRGPAMFRQQPVFASDDTTSQVVRLVETRFAAHPGSLRHFNWPVCRVQALEALADFIACRLPVFGEYQDAMWTDEPFLYHSLLSTSLNLKLLHPLEVIEAAVSAWREGKAPLPAVEGFVRQILGWREYVRGIYWLFMPEYQDRNALQATAPLPAFYWTGETEMNCLRQVIGQTLEYGYAHHIQRLMVTGLYALLLGVDPKQVHEWYLAVYADAVEWVELPNTLGMSQYADGGVMASKPYIASGKYIRRMSNYCSGCKYDPAAATGERACPFTTLYWNFLQRHERQLRRLPRMKMQLVNLDKLPGPRLAAIAERAESIRGRPS